MTPKISACLIVRDEQASIAACLASIRPYVDEIVVLDTGSVDDTPAIVRPFADRHETFLDCNDKDGRIEDFSLARNRSFALATHDVVLWLDGDDVLQGAEHLPALAAELVKHRSSQMLFPYEYSHDDRGRTTLLQYRERLLYPRKRWEWRFPVHENCLLGAGEELQHTDKSELVRIVHSDRAAKPREIGRNLRILKAYIDRVGETDERSLYHLGLEMGLDAMRKLGEGKPLDYLEGAGQALRILKRYVQISRWEDEKALAMLEIARHYQRMNDHDEAIAWATKASLTKSWPEPYFVLMNSFYTLSQQERAHGMYHMKRAAHFGQLGMSLRPVDVAQSLLGQNPTYQYQACEVLAVCQSTIGDMDGAIRTLELGLSGLPEHDLMRSNLEAIRAERSKLLVLGEVAALEANGAIGKGASTIIKGAIRGEFSVQLLEAPTDMPDAAAGRVLSIVRDGADSARSGDGGARASRASGKLDIIFYVGEGYEAWNGETIGRTGLGGSETMAWELARRLARRGHTVRIVGHCDGSAPAGVYDDVEFVDWREFFRGVSPRSACDVLISSRRPEVVDDAAGIEADLRILWIHDVHVGDALTHKRNIRFDRIFALTNWHKSFLRRCYPLVDPSKIVVTRNGIDLERYQVRGGVVRNARRAFYSSSPDRGLDVLLDIWPVVRKSIPDAELHVFYGFENWERGADANEQKKIAHLKAKLQRTAGVRVRGRVSGAELAREQLMCGVWCYPTAFTETSCITAMEAQAAGCRIVTSPLAALNETVGERGQLVAGYGTPGHVDTFASAVVVAMTESLGPRAANDRAALQEYARKTFGLDELAESWESLLITELEDVRTRVVPRFHKAVV